MQLYQGKTFEVVFTEWCQEFPGQCIISCNKESLSSLTPEDWVEFFSATMFNFACLMNNAYRDNATPHVHFHFIPRYQGKVSLLGHTYIDKHFGYNMWKWSLSKFKAQKDIFSKDEKLQMYAMMKEEIKSDLYGRFFFIKINFVEKNRCNTYYNRYDKTYPKDTIDRR